MVSIIRPVLNGVNEYCVPVAWKADSKKIDAIAQGIFDTLVASAFCISTIATLTDKISYPAGTNPLLVHALLVLSTVFYNIFQSKKQRSHLLASFMTGAALGFAFKASADFQKHSNADGAGALAASLIHAFPAYYFYRMTLQDP